MTKSTSLSATKADTISTVQNWLNTENRCVLNAKKSVLFCKTNYFHHLCNALHFKPRRVMSANHAGFFYAHLIFPYGGMSYWFRPVQVLNGPAALVIGVEQRGAEPLLFPQSETFKCSIYD